MRGGRYAHSLDLNEQQQHKGAQGVRRGQTKQQGRNRAAIFEAAIDRTAVDKEAKCAELTSTRPHGHRAADWTVWWTASRPKPHRSEGRNRRIRAVLGLERHGFAPAVQFKPLIA